jgi:hypothetical protein
MDAKELATEKSAIGALSVWDGDSKGRGGSARNASDVSRELVK